MRVSSGTRNSWNDSNESSNDHIPLGRVVTRRHRGQDVQRGSNAGGCEDQSWAHVANVLVRSPCRLRVFELGRAAGFSEVRSAPLIVQARMRGALWGSWVQDLPQEAPGTVGAVGAPGDGAGWRPRRCHSEFSLYTHASSINSLSRRARPRVTCSRTGSAAPPAACCVDGTSALRACHSSACTVGQRFCCPHADGRIHKAHEHNMYAHPHPHPHTVCTHSTCSALSHVAVAMRLSAAAAAAAAAASADILVTID